MADWENLRHFAALAQCGSWSAAARLLRVEHATVARRVAALERDLKLKLVDRRGRRLTLTVAGQQMAPLVERMQRATETIDRAAIGARAELAGTVTISAPPALAAVMIVQPMVALGKRHPDLRIHIVGETRRASLDRREADIAIRLSRPIEGDLTVIKLGEIVFRLYASQAYLAATQPDDWKFIGYDKDMEAAEHQAALLQYMAGRPFALRVSTVDIQLAAARIGGGVAMLPDFMVADDDQLVLAAPNEPSVTQGVWLLVHTDMKNAAPIRVVAQELREYVTRRLRSGSAGSRPPEKGSVKRTKARRRAVRA
ncbi:MAG: LysR family transcriptional regulator [Proteobacteria bacterium]|nr:LysR family transcriptional regulator [Pseudomonadota bacterium]